MNGELLYIPFLLIFLGLSAFFSGSEAALFSLHRAQLRRLEAESHAGKMVASLLSAPRNLLITILIGNLIVNVVSTSIVTEVCLKLFGARGVGIAFAFMSALILVVGEITPKVIALNRPRRFALFAIYPLKFFHTLFAPVRVPLGRFADMVIEYAKKHLGGARRYLSREEMLTAIDMGRTDGQLGDFEYEILSNIVRFRDTTVREVMTPSISVFTLPINKTCEDMFELMKNSGFSRVPVYGETTDDIKGILHIKDLARAITEGGQVDVATLLRIPHYVPESAPIGELFKVLTTKRTQMTVVIDEFGSYVGIVTMEDILEELVGEIRDAKEPRRTSYTILDDRRIIVAGSMEIDEFNEVFRALIEDEEHETIAGYLIGATGKIPEEGETIDVGNLRFHIISARPNRVRKMRVEKK